MDAAKNLAETDYTLDVVTTPLGDQTAPTRPVLNLLVVGNVTDTGADVSWVTDVDAATDVIAGIPQKEYGDPNFWRAIAEANGIDDPLSVTPGTYLLIPSATEAATAATAAAAR